MGRQRFCDVKGIPLEDMDRVREEAGRGISDTPLSEEPRNPKKRQVYYGLGVLGLVTACAGFVFGGALGVRKVEIADSFSRHGEGVFIMREVARYSPFDRVYFLTKDNDRIYGTLVGDERDGRKQVYNINPWWNFSYTRKEIQVDKKRDLGRGQENVRLQDDNLPPQKSYETPKNLEPEREIF